MGCAPSIYDAFELQTYMEAGYINRVAHKAEPRGYMSCKSDTFALNVACDWKQFDVIRLRRNHHRQQQNCCEMLAFKTSHSLG